MRTPVRLLLPAAIVVDDEPDERGNVMAMAIGAAEGALGRAGRASGGQHELATHLVGAGCPALAHNQPSCLWQPGLSCVPAEWTESGALLEGSSASLRGDPFCTELSLE